MATFTKLIVKFFIILLCLLCMPCPSFSATLTVSIKTAPDQAVLPFEVGFEAVVTGGTAPYSFTWNFGDSITSPLAKPSHIYRESGRYTMLVVASDSQGNFGVANKTISVGEASGSFDPRNISYQVFTNTKEVTSLAQDRIDSDVLWIGTTGGLIRYNKAKGDFSYFIQDLPDARVTCIYQQRDGLLWVGTEGGLARFDPAANIWTTFNIENSRLNVVYALLQAADSKIWMVTWDGLARFDPATNAWTTFNTANSGLPCPIITALLQTADGKIWVGTEDCGMARFDQATNAWTTFNTQNSGLPDNDVRALLQSDDGKILIGTRMGGLARFDPVTNAWTTFDTANSGLPTNTITALLQTADGKIWIGAWGRGVTRYDLAANICITFDTTNSVLPANYVHALLQAADGKIWVGTDDGLARFDPVANGWTTVNTANSGLPANSIYALLQAADGKIWVGGITGHTFGGVARFDPAANVWTTFNTENRSLPDNDVYALLQAADGKIWVGTYGGLARFDPGANAWTTFNRFNSALSSNWIFALLQAADGKIWVGTGPIWVGGGGGGLVRFDPAANTWTTFNTANSGLPGNIVYALLEAADGKIWVGTDGGLARFDTVANTWTTFKTANSSLPDYYNSVYALLQTADGKIWVGTFLQWVDPGGGLTRFDPAINAWTTFDTANSGLPSNWVNALLEAADGKIWVGTYGGGLALFDPVANTWTTFNTANSSLPSNSVTALLQAADGKIWVGTGDGLVKMTFQKTSSSSGRSNGRLVLVAGGGAAKSNTLWPTTKNLAVTTYRIFNNRGFANTDIYFISPDKWADVTGDGIDDRVVDCPPSNEDRNPAVADLRYAITDWAVKNYTVGSPLYVYLIDHGWPDDGQHGPYFEVAPGQLLYAKDLNEMLNTYEQATGGKVIVVNESCYSGQFLPPLRKAGRIVFAATADKMANYDAWGANSFTNFFLQKLFENDSLQQAYAKASNTLTQGDLTKDQRPQLDDNGDGKSNSADGIVAASLKLGGDFNTGAAWPQILTAVRSGLSGSACSFTVTTNVHMRRVWAAVQPPNYAPDTSGSYQKIELETFDLLDPNGMLAYTGTYKKFTFPGTYLVTMYVRDQFGNTAVSDPIRIDVGMADKGSISGSVNLQMDNYQVSSGSAGIVARVMETDAFTLVDAGGNFSLYGVPAGTYTVRISGPLFNPVIIPNVPVTAGQTSTLSTPVVVKITGSSTTTTPGDATGDNKLGMDDVIYILQTLSGQR